MPSVPRLKNSTWPSLVTGSALAGLSCALIENLVAASPPPLESRLFALATSAAFWLVVGTAFGIGVLGLRAITKSLSFRSLALVSLLLCLAVAFSFPWVQGVALLAVTTAFVSLASWRKSKSGLGASVVASLLVLLLHPLYVGRAMVLVFSVPQIAGIFLLTVPLLFLSAFLLLGDAISDERRPLAVDIVVIILGGGAAVLLSFFSSVFLIRLWGFNTMEYLQAAVALTQIGLLSRLFWCVLRNVSCFRLSRAVFPLIAILVAALFFVGSHGLSSSPTISFVLRRLPYTSSMIGSLTSALDRDGDGYSAHLGFGDCDETNKAVNPSAVDWPGDGVDQNCFNGDLSSIEMPYFNIPIDVSPPVKTETTRRKVVLFVLVDTLRADAVDYSLSANDHTPNLANLAHNSIRFERAYSHSNNTLESVPFMFHMSFRGLPKFNVAWTLVENLRKGAVRSVGVFQSGGEWWAGDFHRVMLGFDENLLPDLSIRNRSDAETTAAAISALQMGGEKNLFVFVHYNSLHDYATQAMEGGRMIVEGLNLSELANLLNPEKFKGLMRDRYNAALRSVDSALLPLLDAAKSLEKEADVLTIVTSDHGEEFLEHGGLFHMGTLYEELVHVPFLVSGNGISPRVDDTPIGHYRITPTILKFLGYQGEFLDKMNVLALPLTPFEIFAYFSIQERVEETSVMYLEGHSKIIYDLAHNRVEMYDLIDDPSESKDLSGDPTFSELQKRLMSKMDTLRFYLSYGDVELFLRRQKTLRAPGK